MGTYSIKELERLSGIKAHTIRIWEKRHKLIDPGRTISNVRLYSDADLKKLINVSVLHHHGFRISSIAAMNELEINQNVLLLSERNGTHTVNIDRLVTAMVDLDEEGFEQCIKNLEEKFGFEKTVTEVIYPFLERIGILWQTGSITPAHEHFISNLIRQRIIVAISNLPSPKKATLRIVLFLPEHELHELGLLFHHYIARRCGFKTFYLGQSLPHSDLKAICAVHRPHLLITSLTSFPAVDKINGYLQQLCDDFPESRILASGSVLRKASFRFPRNLTFFENAHALREILSALK